MLTVTPRVALALNRTKHVVRFFFLFFWRGGDDKKISVGLYCIVLSYIECLIYSLRSVFIHLSISFFFRWMLVLDMFSFIH